MDKLINWGSSVEALEMVEHEAPTLWEEAVGAGLDQPGAEMVFETSGAYQVVGENVRVFTVVQRVRDSGLN